MKAITLFALAILCSSPLTYCADSKTIRPATRKIKGGEITISPIENEPKLLESLGSLWYEGMGKNHYPDFSTIKERYIQFLASHVGTDTFPLMLVAFLEKQPIGMCALRISAMPRKDACPWSDKHPKATPWLAGLVVAEKFRKRGVGTALIDQCLAQSKRMGHTTVYLLPEDKEVEAIYYKKKWCKIAETTSDGKETAVLSFDIP